MNRLRETEENELKLLVTEEKQAKLLASIQGMGTSDAEVAEILRIVKATLNLAEFDISQETLETILDEYFDTDNLAVFRLHATLRVRRSRGKVEVTVQKIKDIGQGVFSRQEKSEEITEEKYAELIRTGFQDIAKNSFPQLHDKRFSLILHVNNERRSFSLGRRGEQYAFALDLFTYKHTRREIISQVQSEVEIEALNQAAKSKLESIRYDLIDIAKGFDYSRDSKYERGIKHFRIDKDSTRT